MKYISLLLFVGLLFSQEKTYTFTEKEILFDWDSMGLKKIRIVTHLNYTEHDHKHLLKVVDNL